MQTNMDAHGLTHEHVSLDTVLKDTLNAVANNCDLLGRETSKLVVQRRQKSLQNGDFCIPRGCFKMNEEEFAHLKERLLEESKPWTCPIKDVRSDSYNSMLISLDRPTTYKSVISSLLKSEIPCDLNNSNDRKSNKSKGDRCDMNKRRSCDRTILVNVPDCCDCRSLEQLRGLVLTQHVLQLLQANGIRSKLTSHQETGKLHKWLELLNFDSDFIRGGGENSDYEHFLDLAKHSEYKFSERHEHDDGEESKSETTMQHDLDDLDSHKNKPDWLVLDSEKFLASKSAERGVFDKNLGKIHLIDENGSTDTLIQISHLQKCMEEMDQCDCILHIIPDRKSFQQQKIDLGLQMLVKDAPRQVHLVYGSVSERKSPTAHKSDANEFYNLRFDQMKEASVMKYGECVKGAGWKKTIENLTVACVKFELLLNVPRTTVKLDLSEGTDFGGGVDNRAGAFVMYNCARLATLFKHFHKAVEDGVYPPLPTVESIDFGLLREEDEWSLFFNYVFPYADILQNTVAELLPPNMGIYTKLGTHKISNFLIGLSRSLSCYYSRVHILVENRPNLLPTMFARLYLMMSLHSVMKNALLVMGISPPAQL